MATVVRRAWYQFRLSRRQLWLCLAIAGSLVVIGGYLLWTAIAPMLIRLPASNQGDEQAIPALAAAPSRTDTLYIPKIGVTVPILAGDQAVLEKGAWHRWPERGDPEKGGNFILAAHRFQIGHTPGETLRKSPFYHLDKLSAGDHVYVDFHGKRYKYRVAERYTVKPTQSEIEAPSQQPKLTLYSCTLKGEADGREVIIAEPLE